MSIILGITVGCGAYFIIESASRWIGEYLLARYNWARKLDQKLTQQSY